MKSRSQYAQSEISAHIPHCIRVALGDDHPIIRYALREVLAAKGDIKVVGESGGGAEIFLTGTHANADVLIVDFRISDPSVRAALKVFRHSAQKPKLILLSACEDKSELVQALKLGCSGVVLKRSAAEDIVACIRKVYAGGIWVDWQPKLSGPQLSSARNENRDVPWKPYFSRREGEILDLVVQGFTNPEIAARLIVSPQTVKNQLHHMYEKIGVTDRLELILYAVHEGLQQLTNYDPRRKQQVMPAVTHAGPQTRSKSLAT
jgi:two-component system nitrate/nitrite response regulator NarL